MTDDRVSDKLYKLKMMIEEDGPPKGEVKEMSLGWHAGFAVIELEDAELADITEDMDPEYVDEDTVFFKEENPKEENS